MKINISSILLLLVSIYGDKFYCSSINCKEEQFKNISLILLTLVVLSDDKSIDFKEEQPENMLFI